MPSCGACPRRATSRASPSRSTTNWTLLSYDASQTFTSVISSFRMNVAWDGANLWDCSGGNATGVRLGQYTATGASLNTYSPGIDFRSIFTRGDRTSPLYSNETGSNVVQVQGTFGSFSNLVTLGSSLSTGSSVVYDATRAHYIAFDSGIVRRWNSGGSVLSGVTLSGYGSQSGESGTPVIRIATASGYYLTFVPSTGVLSAWNVSGTRVGTTTLTGGSGAGGYSLSYAQGKVWVIVSSTWRGYNVGL